MNKQSLRPNGLKKFDVLVVGAGSGLDIVSYASEKGLKVALLEEGPLGGTCHNRGCIPSKMLIHGADVAETIRNSEKFGITSKIENIDFGKFVKSISDQLDYEAEEMEKAVQEDQKTTLYKKRGKFVGPKKLQIGDEIIESEKIFIVGGTRASIPPIPGLDKISYLTSTEALRLTTQPKHMAVIGGGYIAAELAHFYGAMGTKITILVRGNTLLDREDDEIKAWFAKEFSKKYTVLFNTEAENVEQEGSTIRIKLKGKGEIIECDQLLIATGRIPNTDLLDVKALGVELNEKGYIKVNEYLETGIEGIWAFGDIVGILPFKHTANHQARYAIWNGFLNRKIPVDYNTIGHAVFSSPQVAGVGKTEKELQDEKIPYRVGRYEYKDTGMGDALKENGLVKVLVDQEDNILGCHIIGPDASTLIHEVIVAMKVSGKVDAITESVYIHPALSEVIQRAFLSIE